MLPKKLSYDLASLVQGEKRKAYIVDITFADADSAEIIEESVYLGIVLNKAKLAYPSMSQWLKGEVDMPPALAAAPHLAPTIKLQDQVARAILRKRQQTGALELETNQPTFIWNDNHIENIIVSRQNRAQKLIENLMVTANGVTSRWLVKHKSATVQRVVKEPERWDQIRALATSYGYTLPGEADSLALRGFLATRRVADPLVFPDLSLTVVKLMGRGEYIFTPPGEEGLGHFGLAVVDYTHSTAPNRRYPDLVTQRLIANILLNKPPPYSLEELEAVAKLCTEMETKVSKAERQLNKSACALLLRDQIHQKFDCLITSTEKGNTYLRLLSLPVEGRLVSSPQGLQVGNQVEVELVSVDVRLGFIDFVYHPPKAKQQNQQQEQTQ